MEIRLYANKISMEIIVQLRYNYSMEMSQPHFGQVWG
jgi:hypothetical protein